MSNALCETLVADPLRVTLVWGPSGLKRVLLRWADSPLEPGEQLPGRGVCGSDQSPSLQAALERYVRGERVLWPSLDFDRSCVSPFSEQVLSTLRSQVPWGRTISYGELAALCHKPGAARSIGRAMARNPWPLFVPCHRVIGAKGQLTGFTGAGLSMKEYLLRTEGALP